MIVRILFVLVTATAIAFTGRQASEQPDRRVQIVATPDGGIQPQALVDVDGTIPLVYFKGESAAGDLYYVRRRVEDASFSAAVRVNNDAGSAIATGSVRGGQIALDRNGWVYVAWNGSSEANAKCGTRALRRTVRRSSLNGQSADAQDISMAADRSRPTGAARCTSCGMPRASKTGSLRAGEGVLDKRRRVRLLRHGDAGRPEVPAPDSLLQRRRHDSPAMPCG